ncbi:outer membrane lipoprotein carrier protein LolA [bacterium]|nr:outer membrane lipoprotein carrier protein LolA [bacterium]
MLLIHLSLSLLLILPVFQGQSSNLTLLAAEPTAVAERVFSTEEETVFLAGLDEQYGQILTQQCDFVQLRYLDAFQDTLTAQGRCWFESPDRLRWEVMAPLNSVIIYDHDQTGKYEVNAGVLTRQEEAREDLFQMMLKQIAAWMRGDFQSGKEMFELQVVEQQEVRIELEPRAKGIARGLRKIELQLDPGSLRVIRVKLFESGSDFIQIDFYNVILDQPLPSALFDLNNPLPQGSLESD